MESLSAEDPRAAGDYQLLARLGAGGMGTVFLAASAAGQLVALKIIHADLARDPTYVSRFRGEIAAAQAVSPRHTAPVVASSMAGPTWLATVFVPGPSLEAVVTRHGPLPAAAVWRLAAGLAEALQAIHAADLVHRDLKPDNVLLTLDGPKVIDFGISRGVSDPRMTRAGMIMGTPAYSSPEQVAGEPGGPAADVFALGSVLAFAASGMSPFSRPGVSSASVFRAVMRAEPDLGAVPAQLRQFIAACLAKDPRQRPEPGRLAAVAARYADQRGLPPGWFWPEDLARIVWIHEHEAAAAARALMAPAPVLPAGPDAGDRLVRPSPVRPGEPGAGGQPALPSPVWPADAGTEDRPAGGGPARNRPGDGGRAGDRQAGGGHAAGTGGVSRRRLLTGATAAGVAVAGGLIGWRLTRSSGAAPGGSGPRRRAARSPAGGGAGQPVLPQFAHLAPGQQAWNFPASGAMNASPMVSGGMVYVGGGNGADHLYAVSVATGRPAWTYPAVQISATPTVAAGVVCAAGSSGDIYAIHAGTGALAWHRRIGVTPPPFSQGWAMAGRSVITTARAGDLQAYGTVTGAPGRLFTTGAGFSWAVAAAGDILYALDLAGTVHAVAIATGRTAWATPVLGNELFAGHLAVAGSAVYVGSGTSDTLYALNAQSGARLWMHRAGAGLSAAPAVAGGVVYLTGTSGMLRALTAARAAPLWTRRVDPAVYSSPAVAGGAVYVCSHTGLEAFDARSGTPLWSFATPDRSAGLGTPAAAHGLVFFGSAGGSLYAVRA